MNKKIFAIICNILIIGCSIANVLFFNMGIEQLYFYTQDANIIAGISALLFLLFLLIKKEINEIPMFIMILKFISATALMLSLLVVLGLLIPQRILSENTNMPWYILLIGRSMIFGHIFNPLISLISFIFFENDKRFNKKNNIYFPLVFTLIYGIILLVFNYLKLFDGPYFFLRIHNQEIYMMIIWIVLILIMNYLIAKILLIQNQKRVPRRTAEIKKRIASK